MDIDLFVLCDTRYPKLYTAGPFTLGDLMTVLPYPDPLVAILITAADLFNAMESGLAHWPQEEGQVI